jgi:hypothetical protein
VGTPNLGNSWRIICNNFDGSQGGRTAIQISGGSSFEIKENTITRSGNATGITKYGITLTNNNLDLDQNQEQLLYTKGTTCLDKAGPASNLAKALYFVVSDGLVLETEDCETVIEERTNRQKKLKPVRLYPNPSSGVISIDLLEDTDVEIVNQLGTVVRSYKLQSGTHTLNLDLSNGVYFIRDGKSLIEKILITK